MASLAPAVLPLANILAAAERIHNFVIHTPTQKNSYYSELLQGEIFFKREDLQNVRSYKIRGAANKILSLTEDELKNGVVCASAGNHAQGVAYVCRQKGTSGVIFMPTTTPRQKVQQVEMFGKDNVRLVLQGDTFDDCCQAAVGYCRARGSTFIHPFDDEKIIEGQATLAVEMLKDLPEPLDLVLIPIGGGGLAAGVASAFKQLSPHTRLIGVEPRGASAMNESIGRGRPITLEKIDPFTDGAAVRRVGDITFAICRDLLDDIFLVDEGKICETMLDLYNREALVIEPAGALTVAVLEQQALLLRNKRVACIISGGNNDIGRTEEIRHRALLYRQLKHYFILRLPQRAGALREFVNHVLGPEDDIIHFQYVKKFNREKGPVLIGIELKDQQSFQTLKERIKLFQYDAEYINEKPDLLEILI